MRSDPKISIVIAARTGAGPVLNCLRSLTRLPERESFEVIVANSSAEPCTSRIAAEFPDVKLVRVSPDSSIAQGRAAAIRLAKGDLIAVLHERYAVGEGWLRAVLEAHASDCDVAGGCVAPAAHLSTAAWAMYLSEYSHICPPMPTGALSESEALMLPGGNVSYKRRVLGMADMDAALWELDFHAALARGGARFLRGRSMNAEFAHPFTVGEYIAERYEVSRDFAALHAQHLPVSKRFIVGTARVALPLLVLARIAARVLRRGYAVRFARALPWMIFFSLVQMAGEMAGYAAPGQLAARGVKGATSKAAGA